MQTLQNQQLEAKKRREAKEQMEQKYNFMYTIKWPLVDYYRDKRIKETLEELEVQKWAQIWCIKMISQKVFARMLLKMRRLMRIRKIEIANQFVAQIVRYYMVTKANKKG